MTEFNCPFAFVIDTEQYSGNFERELCAYVTGRVGECEVGEEAAAQFKAEEAKELAMAFEDVVVSLPDDHGCFRPASIFPTPGWINNGNGKHLREDSPEAKKLKAKWPAYQSVAIWFDSKPTQEMINTMVRRALKASQMKHRLEGLTDLDITITGFRLLKQHKEIDEIATFPIK